MGSKLSIFRTQSEATPAAHEAKMAVRKPAFTAGRHPTIACVVASSEATSKARAIARPPPQTRLFTLQEQDE